MRRSILAALLAVSLFGCAPQTPPQSAEVERAEVEVSRMAGERARAQIAPSFPLEVPVPDGRVEQGQAQGTDAWDYSLVVDADVTSIAKWYRASYSSLSWEVVGDRAIEGGGVQLDLRKGGAESRVTITPEGAETRVSGVLGIGVPVLQVQ